MCKFNSELSANTRAYPVSSSRHAKLIGRHAVAGGSPVDLNTTATTASLTRAHNVFYVTPVLQKPTYQLKHNSGKLPAMACCMASHWPVVNFVTATAGCYPNQCSFFRCWWLKIQFGTESVQVYLQQLHGT